VIEIKEKTNVLFVCMANKRLERFMVTLAVALLAFPVIPHSARVVTELIWPSISEIDPEGVYLWISIHHVFQLAFTVLVMKFIFRLKLRDWGFNLNKLPESLRIFGSLAVLYQEDLENAFNEAVDAEIETRLSGLTRPSAVGIIDPEHTRRRLRELQTELDLTIVSDD